MKQIAKIFTNGRSQAVRLPKEFRFQESEVFIGKDPHTGNLIISAKPSDWSGLRFALEALKPPKDFLSKKERQQKPFKRDPFKGWVE
jgi:antitoxin VapB